MKKRIGFVTLNDFVPWGGSEVFWSELAGHFLRDGYEVGVSVFFWEPTPKHVAALSAAGATVFYKRGKITRELSLPKKIVNRFLPSSSMYRAETRSDKYDMLDQFKPDLVFLSLGDHNTGGDWMEELTRRGIPYFPIVQLVRDNACFDERGKQYPLWKKGYLGAEQLLLTSFDNKKILERHLCTTLEKAVIVNNPLKKPAGEVRFPRNEKYAIANVASLNVNHKAQDLLLEALCAEKWRKRNLHVNFYGTGPHSHLLRDLAKKWELENVVFNDFDSIENIWNTNQLLIMPSRYEGLSLAFLEAMGCGRAAIMTDLGDASRFIDDNVNGFIIKGCNTAMVDEALERAWEKREAWEEMGKKARARIEGMIPDDPVHAYYTAFLQSYGK